MQNENFCINCGSFATEQHHIVPLAIGGNDVDTNKVWLCSKCHALIHGTDIEKRGTYWKNLQRAGINRAKQQGIKFGRPTTKKPENWNNVIIQLKNKEITAIKAMELTHTTKSTFYKYFNQWSEEVI